MLRISQGTNTLSISRINPPKFGGGLKFESDADIVEKDSSHSGTSYEFTLHLLIMLYWPVRIFCFRGLGGICQCFLWHQNPSPNFKHKKSIIRVKSAYDPIFISHKSLNQGHAIFMPDAEQTVNRLPIDLSWNPDSAPVLTSSLLFRHLSKRFYGFKYSTCKAKSTHLM